MVEEERAILGQRRNHVHHHLGDYPDIGGVRHYDRTAGAMVLQRRKWINGFGRNWAREYGDIPIWCHLEYGADILGRLL
jgi:hypothetical protein